MKRHTFVFYQLYSTVEKPKTNQDVVSSWKHNWNYILTFPWGFFFGV